MKQQRSPAAVWDCESSLYDSFELRSFEKQLSSALTSRTLSMPHLSSDRVRKKINTTMSSKISKSVQRFLKSVFIARSNDHNHRHIKSLVRKTASERFTAARAPMAGYGISCA
ncbi:hypothetical protein LINGRAHAP2_LOCUS25462 [Linum grandiflorum]